MDLPFPIMVIVTLIAALGFALFFNVNKRHVIAATIGGVLTWSLDYILMMFIDGIFIPCIIASIFAAVYAEVLSRITHTPVTVFFIIAVIPLIPGRGLYYTMYNAVSQDFATCMDFASMTLLYACGIAVGICIVTAVVQTWNVWAADKARRFAHMVKKQSHRGSGEDAE